LKQRKLQFFTHRVIIGTCENSNPDHYGPEGGVLTEKSGGMFRYTDLYGGYNGRQKKLENFS
jgi:hypothetical protein